MENKKIRDFIQINSKEHIEKLIKIAKQNTKCIEEGKMTKEEFEKCYCERSGITIEEYHNDLNLITLPCSCDYEGCDGWAAITNESHFIEIHKRLYS
jgi:hypothetical protein